MIPKDRLDVAFVATREVPRYKLLTARSGVSLICISVTASSWTSGLPAISGRVVCHAALLLDSGCIVPFESLSAFSLLMINAPVFNSWADCISRVTSKVKAADIEEEVSEVEGMLGELGKPERPSRDI